MEETKIEKTPELEKIIPDTNINNKEKEASAPDSLKQKEKMKKGYRVAHAFWILFQIASVLLFIAAVLSLLIAPAFPFIFRYIPRAPGPDAGFEALGYALEVVIYIIIGIVVGFLMIVNSFFMSTGSIVTGFIGFLISVIKRPKRKKWKAVISFGFTTIPPVVLAIIDAILIIIGVIIAIISAVSNL